MDKGNHSSKVNTHFGRAQEILEWTETQFYRTKLKAANLKSKEAKKAVLAKNSFFNPNDTNSKELISKMLKESRLFQNKIRKQQLFKNALPINPSTGKPNLDDLQRPLREAKQVFAEQLKTISKEMSEAPEQLNKFNYVENPEEENTEPYVEM